MPKKKLYKTNYIKQKNTMVKYICLKCGKEFKKKYDFDYHMNKRKSSCVKQNDGCSQLLTVAHKCSQNNKKEKDQKTIKETNSLYSCDFCESKFSRKSNLVRHKNMYCKNKKEKDNENKDNIISSEYIDNINTDEETKKILKLLLNQLNELKEELKKEKLNYTTNNTTNNTTNTNLNNNSNNTINNTNINVIAHGTDELKKIELSEILTYLSSYQFRKIIPDFARHVYINDSKPENKNFYITDISRDSCKMHNGKRWIRAKASDKINTMMEKLQWTLTDPFEKENIQRTIEYIQKNKKFYNEKLIKLSVSFLNDLDNVEEKENIEIKKDILEELKLIFYNNKEEILKIKLNK